MHIYGGVSLWMFHVTLWLVGICTDPLHLSPFLERGDIKSALELSEVRDPQKIIPKSYAGFVTVDKQLGNHLFFWFFPAISEPLAPVLVWLNGGPGISSMFGLLWENGPIRVARNISATRGKISYKRWEKSWTESFAMLYIDNPVGTGYSYSDSGQRGWKTTNSGYTEDLFSFISQFYILFPDYLNTQLYIGGQSYAGRYVPAVAYRIHKEIQANRSALPLAGIYLGGPFFDAYIQTAASAQFYYALGAITKAQMVRYQTLVKYTLDTTDFGSGIHMSKVSGNLIMAIQYDQDNYYTRVPPGNYLVDYLMNTYHIRQRVHVGNKLRFKVLHEELHEEFASDFLVSTKTQLAEIMDNYKVLIYSGDFDGIVTVVDSEEAILSTPWSLQGVYNESDRQSWNNGSTVVGYYTHVGQFCRVIVRNAGHQTPNDQPDITRKMMLDFVRHGCIHQGGTPTLEVSHQSTVTLLTGKENQTTMTTLTSGKNQSGMTMLTSSVNDGSSMSLTFYTWVILLLTSTGL